MCPLSHLLPLADNASTLLICNLCKAIATALGNQQQPQHQVPGWLYCTCTNTNTSQSISSPPLSTYNALSLSLRSLWIIFFLPTKPFTFRGNINTYTAMLLSHFILPLIFYYRFHCSMLARFIIFQVFSYLTSVVLDRYIEQPQEQRKIGQISIFLNDFCVPPGLIQSKQEVCFSSGSSTCSHCDSILQLFT